ncbi:MAG: hypothetical protein RR873_02675 [Christensenella sp.]
MRAAAGCADSGSGGCKGKGKVRRMMEEIVGSQLVSGYGGG